MAGVGDHGKVRQFLHERDRREVEQVARGWIEAAYPALTEDDLRVAFGQDVFGAHQEIGDRGGHAALEQHRLANPANGPEQGVVLHVARADLNAVGDLRHQMRSFIVERFGDDGQPRFAPRERQELEPFRSQSLERVGRAAWLVRTAAQRRTARVAHLLRREHDLLLGLHRARPGDDRDFRPAEHDAGCDGDEGVLGTPLARHLLVRLGHMDHLGHAIQCLESRAIHPPVVAHEADRCALRAGHGARLIPHLLDQLDHARHLLARRIVIHDHQHQSSSISKVDPSSASDIGPA